MSAAKPQGWWMARYAEWVHRYCERFAILASAELDAPLSAVQRARQATHRALCSTCRQHEHYLHRMGLLARELGRSEAGALEVAKAPALSAEARERIRKAALEEWTKP